jgi:hypothetical protein
LAFAIACGSRSHPPLEGSGGGQPASSSTGGFGGGGGQPPQNPACSAGTDLVYTVSEDNVLRRFDPTTHTFESIGMLTCNDPTVPFSMAVDRHGVAWVLYATGRLFNVQTADASCTTTSFAPGQHGFTTFGMGFSSNAKGSTDETLFVDANGHLGKIDTNTLTLDDLGPFDKTQARAELTGTGDGRLFGAFEGMPYVVSEIDKTNAAILSMAPQSAINYPPNGSNFAFAFWGGDFWLFVGPGMTTDVFHYAPSTGMTTKVQSESFTVVGAGVSTCAPTVPPK